MSANLKHLYNTAKEHKDTHKHCGAEPYLDYEFLYNFIVNLNTKKSAPGTSLSKEVDTTKGSAGDLLFVVLGFGPEEYKQELQDRINKNNLQNNFFLLGKTPNAFQYLKGLDLFVLTSVKEGLPYSILEAKLAGVQVVATSVGGIPEIAEHVQIRLAESQNVADIAGKIAAEVLSGRDEGKNGDSGPGLPEIFKLKNMVQETERVYNQIR
jgi:glycosyltransferase involved in cell wall biosynthesis